MSSRELTWNKNLLSGISIMGEMGHDIGTAIQARPMHHYLDEADVEHTLDTRSRGVNKIL